jgi:hypothetical protein
VELSSRNPDCEGIVSLSNLAIKVAEMADKLELDIIIMGTKGLGRTDANVRHVTGKALNLKSRATILINSLDTGEPHPDLEIGLVDVGKLAQGLFPRSSFQLAIEPFAYIDRSFHSET